MYIISWSFFCANILIYTYNLYSHPYLNLYLYLYSILCLIVGTLTGHLYIYVEIY